MENLKKRVKQFWEDETCGIRYGQNRDKKTFYEQIANERYQLEPYIKSFANFGHLSRLKVLEVGVRGCGF